MHGFFLIDKPSGISSFDCIRKLRRVCNIRRMGFAGTLDPLATGLMILAVGEATKLLSYLEKSDKVYDVGIFLGATSDTYDSQGKITVGDESLSARAGKNLSKSGIQTFLEDNFLGEQQQVPPIFSAIHVDGKRAYDLARKGEKVELKSRKVVFFDLKVKAYAWPDLHLQVHCSSGTYVRSLAHDLGQKLGCGGYVKDLRRVKIGSFKVQDAVALDQIDAMNFASLLLTPQEFFKDWQRIDLNEEQYKILANGGLIDNLGNLSQGPILAIFNGICVGVLEVKNGMLKFESKFNLN